MTDEWTYRRVTGREVLERALWGIGFLGLGLLSFMDYTWLSGSLLVRAAMVASVLAVIAGVALGIMNRRERKAAATRSSDSAPA